MKPKCEIRRELVKYKDNLRKINRLIASSDSQSNDLFKEKLKIKYKIEKLEDELERKDNDEYRKSKK